MRKKGLFSLLEDCDHQRQDRHTEMEPVHQYKLKNGQTDVVISKPKPGQQKAKTKSVSAKHYDDNGAVSLTYANGSYHLQPDRPQAFAQQHSYVDQVLTEDQDYYVEPFDTPPTSESMTAIKTPQHVSAPTAPVKKYPVDDADYTETPTYPAEGEDKKKPASTDRLTPVLPASEEDAAFAEDIKAILSGKKAYDQFQKKMVPAEEVSTQAPTPQGKPSGKPQAKPEAKEFSNEHAIFDKIAQSMQLATSYDLGSIDLDQRFDHFDKEIEKKEETIQNPKKATDSLTDQQISPQNKPEAPLKKEDIPPVETIDFLKDLDKMKQAKQMASIFSKSSQGPLTGAPASPQEPQTSTSPAKPVPATTKKKPSEIFFEKFRAASFRAQQGNNDEAVVLQAKVIGANGEVLFDSSNNINTKFGTGHWEDYPGREGILTIYANDQDEVYTASFVQTTEITAERPAPPPVNDDPSFFGHGEGPFVWLAHKLGGKEAIQAFKDWEKDFTESARIFYTYRAPLSADIIKIYEGIKGETLEGRQPVVLEDRITRIQEGAESIINLGTGGAGGALESMLDALLDHLIDNHTTNTDDKTPLKQAKRAVLQTRNATRN